MSNLIRLLILTILTASLQAGTTQTPKPPEQEQPLRLKTDLIEIRAVVTDRQGRIVRDLKKEDFEVLEDSREQQIAFFSSEEIPVRSTRPGATPRSQLNIRQPDPTTKPRRTIGFFIDTLHLSDESFLNARQMLRRFIDEQVGDDDLVAVISSGGPMGIFNQFTRNRRMLQYAVETLRAWGVNRSKYTPHIASMVSLQDSSAISAAIQIVSAELRFEATERDVKMLAREVLSKAARWRDASLDTLDAAVKQMSGLPGQRIVFYISDGFSLQSNVGNASGAVNRVTSRAARSGVVIYSIDARGLETDPMFNDPSSNVVFTPVVHRYVSDSSKEVKDGINALAKDTGGEAYFNNNDMGGSMKRALDSARVYYALAYYAPDQRRGSGFRRLTVRVRNHPDYSVRAQKGYLPAEAIKDETAKQSPQQKVINAIASPIPQTGIGVGASAYYLERDLDDSQVSIEVFIDGASLTYGERDGATLVDCEITTAIFDKTGKSTKVITDKVQGTLTPERLEQGRKTGYRYVKRITLKPGVYQARIGVRENGSERIGTANAWVEVPDLGHAKLAVGSIILNRLGKASEETRPDRDRVPDLLMPDVKQGLAFFKKGTSLAYHLTVYQSGTVKAPEPDLLIQSEVTREGQSIYRSEWQPITERLLRLGKKGFDAGGQINLDIAPGICELHITVKDPKTKRSAQQYVIFEVED